MQLKLLNNQQRITVLQQLQLGDLSNTKEFNKMKIINDAIKYQFKLNISKW